MRILGLLLVLLFGTRAAAAQEYLFLGARGIEFWNSPVAVDGWSLDERWFRSIHAIDSPWASSYLGAIDSSVYPALVVAPVAVVVGAIWSDDIDRRDLVFVAGSWGATATSMFVLKRSFRRSRPYRALSDISARQGYVGTKHLDDDSSMPSGHAMLVSTIATTAALLAPKWYVVTGAAVWASSVSVSRIWLGVHYPSDVMVGTALGTGITLISWLALQ